MSDMSNGKWSEPGRRKIRRSEMRRFGVAWPYGSGHKVGMIVC